MRGSWTGLCFLAQVLRDTHAEEAEEVFIAVVAVMAIVGIGSADGGAVDTVRYRVRAILVLLRSLIAQERPQDDCIRDGGTGEDLARRPDCAVLLSALTRDDFGHARRSHGNHDDRQAEQRDQLEFALPGLSTAKDNGNREGHEQDIGNDIASPHRNKLCKALPAMWSRIWADLPVMVERLALR